MSTDKIAEYQLAFEQGRAGLVQLFEHYKRADFTPEEYMDWLRERDVPRIKDRIIAFYEGRLFQTQAQGYEDWCNGKHLDADRRRADDFGALMRSTGIESEEIKIFIKLRVHARRVPMDKQMDSTVDERNAALMQFAKRNIELGWAAWPKPRPDTVTFPKEEF